MGGRGLGLLRGSLRGVPGTPREAPVLARVKLVGTIATVVRDPRTNRQRIKRRSPYFWREILPQGLSRTQGREEERGERAGKERR